jgi:23S rRNA pseudouridine1911/1915/1917 synthase
MTSFAPFPIPADQAGQTLAAVLRSRLPGQSWRQVRQLVAARRVKVLGEVCLDPARRLREGDIVEFLARPAPTPRDRGLVTLRHLDEHIVVVEKPSGVCTVRHPLERDWNDRRKALSPTLQDMVPPAIADSLGKATHAPQPRLRIVHRLDKETSGLVVFARSVPAERGLGKQFHAHTVVRRYLAIVPGRVRKQTISTSLVRDRGDGRRGSTTSAPRHPPAEAGPADRPAQSGRTCRGGEGEGKHAVTHVEPVEELPGYTLLSCRLETGRTHQIRIHLSELGHPVCGERVYRQRLDGTMIPDDSGAPRLALHATELGFEHPVTRENLHWSMPLPADLEAFVVRLRGGVNSDAD